MHEFSLCRSVASTVEQHANGREVRSVHLRIGYFRQVVPETMEYCWEIQVSGSALDGSRLDIEHVPAVVRCLDCGEDTALDMPIRRCAACGSASTDLLSGDEFLIDSIDVSSREASDAVRDRTGG